MAEESTKKKASDKVRELSWKLSTIKSHFDPEGMTIQNDMEAIFGVGLFIDEMIAESIVLEDEVYELEEANA